MKFQVFMSTQGGRRKMAQGEDKFGIIMEAARTLFCSQGYDTTSMDLVAREAAVSKATVYAHFKSKEQLLLTLVQAEVDRLPLARHRAPPASATELKDALTGMGEQFAMLFRQDRTLALSRLVVAQAINFPQIAEAFYEAAPLRARREVRDVLEGAVAGGLLAIKDTTQAATQFLSLVGGELPLRALLSLPPLSTEAVRALVEDGIDVFLAAYGRDAD